MIIATEYAADYVKSSALVVSQVYIWYSTISY